MGNPLRFHQSYTEAARFNQFHQAASYDTRKSILPNHIRTRASGRRDGYIGLVRNVGLTFDFRATRVPAPAPGAIESRGATDLDLGGPGTAFEAFMMIGKTQSPGGDFESSESQNWNFRHRSARFSGKPLDPLRSGENPFGRDLSSVIGYKDRRGCWVTKTGNIGLAVGGRRDWGGAKRFFPISCIFTEAMGFSRRAKAHH